MQYGGAWEHGFMEVCVYILKHSTSCCVASENKHPAPLLCILIELIDVCECISASGDWSVLGEIADSGNANHTSNHTSNHTAHHLSCRLTLYQVEFFLWFRVSIVYAKFHKILKLPIANEIHSKVPINLEYRLQMKFICAKVGWNSGYMVTTYIVMHTVQQFFTCCSTVPTIM